MDPRIRKLLLTALAGLVTGALARLLVSRLMKEER